MEEKNMKKNPPLLRSRNLQASKCIPSSLHVLPTVTHRPHRLVIASRGASYHLPEHTLPAYRLALELGADFVQPSIIATSDKKLIAMESLDLNATTNVEQVFPDREPWFSPTANKKGYWAFNFTYDEISQLRVRQRLPNGRTIIMDNLFQVPLLEEIVEVILEWNRNELLQTLQLATEVTRPTIGDSGDSEAQADMLRKPTALELAQSGLYLDLKEANWQMEEAGLDIAKLLFAHFEDNSLMWNWLMPCFQELKYDTYKVPGLVIQAFDMEAIKRFHEMWIEDKDATVVPEPPYVVTADTSRCEDPKFWHEIDTHYQDILSAISPDKHCLIKRDLSAQQESMTMAKALDFHLAVHPYSEQPEKKFLADPSFETVTDETNFLFCNIGVEGIFTESVNTAFVAAKMGCKNGLDDPGFQNPTQYAYNKQDPPYCYDSGREIGIYVGVSFFFLGVFTSYIVHLIVQRKKAKDSSGEIIDELDPTEIAELNACLQYPKEIHMESDDGSDESSERSKNETFGQGRVLGAKRGKLIAMQSEDEDSEDDDSEDDDSEEDDSGEDESEVTGNEDEENPWGTSLGVHDKAGQKENHGRDESSSAIDDSSEDGQEEQFADEE